MIRDVKWKSPWYINPLTFRTILLPSCTNFRVLQILIFLELTSNTNMFGAHTKLIGCVFPEEQSDISHGCDALKILATERWTLVYLLSHIICILACHPILVQNNHI